MYVLYKPMVQQGESEVHKQTEQVQPSTSGIQLDLRPYNQPLDIRSQTILQTQLPSGLSSSSQIQPFLQSQPFIQSFPSQGQMQHVIQGQQAVQGTYVQVGQQLFQVQPMVTGQNLGHPLSTDVNNANLSVNIGQISPVLNINSSNYPSQRQIITHIKSEPVSKQHTNIPSLLEIENTVNIKTEVLDPEYEKQGSANSTEAIANTNLNSGQVYPTGLVTNACMLNDQSGKESYDNTDTQTHLLDKEQTHIDLNSKENWMDKALTHWKKWAISKQKNLASKGLTCTGFTELIKCVRGKKQLLELVFEFAFDLVDENGKTYSWDYMSKIISMLEEGSKEALRWIDVKMLYVAKTAYTARKKDIADEIMIKKVSEMKPQQKPVLQQLKPILPKPNSSQNSCSSNEESSTYLKTDLMEKDSERHDFQANYENDETAMASTNVTKNTSNNVLNCNVTSSSNWPSLFEKCNRHDRKKRERDAETSLEALVKKIKKEPIENTDIEIYSKEKPVEITSDETSTVIHANPNETITSTGAPENLLYTRVNTCNMQGVIPSEIISQGPFCIESVTSLANEPSDNVPVDRYHFLGGRDPDINKSSAADNVDDTSTSKNIAVNTDIEPSNSSVPGNTLKNNNWANNTWNDWAKARNKANVDPDCKPVPLLHSVYKNVTEEELNDLLIKFIHEVRNSAGAPYPPNSIRSLIAGFQRIFRRSGWTNLSLFDSTKKEFSKFHKALDERCIELIKQGIGVKKKQAQMITDQQEQVLWDKGVFSLDMSWGLLYAVYFYTCKVFCVGPSYELWKLRVSQFSFGEDETGKYVQFTSRIVSSKKYKPVKQYKCEDNPRTYYNLLETYILIIPKVNDIFWFRPSRDFVGLPINKSRLVFSRCPLGKNMLDSLISKMMKQAGYKGYYTNHSVKATMAAKMFKQGYQEEFIQERTGHSSTVAVKKYNKGIRNAEAVRADISSTLDPPPPKIVKQLHIVNNECKNTTVGITQFKVVTLPKVPEKQSDNLHELENQTKSYEDVQASSKISQQEIEILQREKDKQNKEILILKKTVDEMELRIETQKQTLSARDESMKKLLEMLQSKGLSVQKIEDNQQEVEHLQTRQLEDDRKIKQLQNTISQNELEMSKVKEENSKLSDELKHSKLQLKQQPSSTHTMQAILEAKDSRISALEKEVQSLEDRLMTLQEEGSIHYDRKDKDAVSSSREKTLKAEVDLYKKETSRKDKELLGLTMKKETLENQQTEHQQYIHLLKEQITAKDQQVVMLQSDLEDLRDRVKDKDSTIDRKAQKSQSLQSEKRKIETEVSELKEQLEIKDRRISNLQIQIDSLESAVNEKETELRDATTKLESQESDDKIQMLEESLSEKDKQIDRLKEQKHQSEREHQEELDVYSKASQDIKTRLDSLQLEFNEKQTELVDLREHSTEAQSVKFEADSKIRQLESSLDDKTSEVEKLNVRIEELKGAIPETKAAEELQKQTSDLSSQLETARNEANKAQEEVDRLVGVVKETENEKNDKENQIKELQELMKEYKQKVGTLKRKQSMEKKNSATMLEEARKREDSLYDDATQLEDHMKSKNDRIEELEEALKESVKITAEREMVMVDLQTQLEEAERKVDEYTMDLVKAKSENLGKVEKMTKIMEDKDIKLKKLHAERHKHLEEVFEMKQEAILAAMSEKDANIALLEMTSSKKQNYKEEIEKLNNDKEKLQQQLSDVTHNRMKLIQKQERREERKKSSLPRKKRESPLEAPESQPVLEQPPAIEQTDS
ncbi:uncharacterized protein LOC134683169 isoform X1 [Mytilus trossulus]|uniref:uncharacterized protein LOC134683169 isoform X1 n=1 Tax=Mytilus trossulus TaxID=6551 RepID=UPI003007946B